MYWRTTGPWGAGTGANLTATEFDANNWQLVQMIAAKATAGVGIAALNVVGDELWVTLTDHTLLGPYILPVATLVFVGTWQPSTQYYVNQIFTINGSTYIVLINHISAASFDPGANDGHGHNLYGLLLSNPGNALPTGGAVGMVLEKATTADFSALWAWPTLAGLHDVLQSPAPATGQLVQWQGSSFGYIDPSAISTAHGSFRTLTDVLASPAPTPGQLVYWNGTKFSYASPSSVGGTIDLAGLSDVLASPAPTDGQVLIWSSSAGKFTYASPGGGGTLAGLSDVNIGSRFTVGRGDVLTWNDDDSRWENQPQQPYLTNSNTSYAIRYTDIYSFIDSTSSSSNPIFTINLDLSIGILADGPYVTVRQAVQNSTPVRFLAASGVTFDTPPGRLAAARTRGSVIQAVHQAANNWAIVGDLAYDASAAVFAATGTISLDPLAADIEVFTSIPGASQTINLSQAPAYGQRMTLVVTTSGTSSWTLTFGANFKTTGTLATGSVSGKVFTIGFISDGVNFNEVSRTTAM